MVSARLTFSCHNVTLTYSPVSVLSISSIHLGSFSFMCLSICQEPKMVHETVILNFWRKHTTFNWNSILNYSIVLSLPYEFYQLLKPSVDPVCFEDYERHQHKLHIAYPLMYLWQWKVSPKMLNSLMNQLMTIWILMHLNVYKLMCKYVNTITIPQNQFHMYSGNLFWSDLGFSESWWW